jgi:hypothetical protein
MNNSNSNNAFVNENDLIKRSYRKVFLQLDEATLTFNADWKKVNINYFKFNLKFII